MFGKWKSIIEIIQSLSNTIKQLTDENKALRNHYNSMSARLTKQEQSKFQGTHYVVTFEDEDTVELYIKSDVNRPNQPDDEELIREYVENNYGNKKYQFIQIDMNKVIHL